MIGARISTAAFLLAASTAHAGTCINPPATSSVEGFARHLYSSADSIALVRVDDVSDIPSSELRRATVASLEELKGKPLTEFQFHSRRMPTLPTPKVGVSRVIAVSGGVAPSCLNIFAASFPQQELVAELRKVANGQSKRPL